MTLQVKKILELPVEALAEMLAESRVANFRAIDRLVNDWITAANRFDRSGEVLFVAQQGSRIVGICGLNYDPYTHSTNVGRVRRLYVMQDSRRQGIGRLLVHQIIQTAKPNFDRLHVRTTNPVAAQFYRSLGFMVCNHESVTHVLNLTEQYSTLTLKKSE